MPGDHLQQPSLPYLVLPQLLLKLIDHNARVGDFRRGLGTDSPRQVGVQVVWVAQHCLGRHQLAHDRASMRPGMAAPRLLGGDLKVFMIGHQVSELRVMLDEILHDEDVTRLVVAADEAGGLCIS